MKKKTGADPPSPIDITKRKQAEEHLRRLATVVQDSNDAVLIYDLQGRLQTWNHGAQLMYGYSEAEALQMNIVDTIPEGKRAELQAFMERLSQGEAVSSLETQRLTKDRRLLDVWLTGTVLTDDRGAPVAVASTERDITERKRAETGLRRLAMVVIDSNDAITVQDLDGKISAWNRGAERMYGYTESEARAMNIQEIIPEAKRQEALAFMKRVLKGAEEVPSFETQRHTKDGRTLDIWLTVTRLLDAAGKPVGIATTERDITERKRVEEALKDRTIQLETANKELEAFSYSVSHDLRAPLRAISGFASILEEDHPSSLDAEGRRCLQVIRTSIKQMGQLIDDLLAFSRLGSQSMALGEINMGELAQAVVEELRLLNPERKVQVKIPPLLPARGDRAMIHQVLMNLLSNAMKFTRPRATGVIEVGARTEGSFTVYSVKDNGVGFDMRYADKLFGVFQRLHPPEEFEGTGVGLALAQRVIHRHGGRVWAEGKVNEGATFYFTLPTGGSQT